MEAAPLQSKIMILMSTAVDITIYTTRWVPCSGKIVALGAHPKGTGALQLYEIGSDNLEKLHDLEVPLPLKCGTFGASGIADRQLATGGHDGRMSLWDLTQLQKPIASAKAHIGIVNAIDGAGSKGVGPPEIATAGQDGAVRVWDTRQPDAPVAAFVPGASNRSRECWTVAFGDCYGEEQRCLLAGFDNGDLKLFDLRTNKIRWHTNVGNGVCHVAFDRATIPMNKLLAGTLEAQFHVFDARTHHPALGFAKASTCLDVKATAWGCHPLPQNRDLFMVTSGAGAHILYKYHYPDKRSSFDAEGEHQQGIAGSTTQICELVPTDQPVSSFDWSADKAGLFCSGSFDQRIRVGSITFLNRH